MIKTGRVAQIHDVLTNTALDWFCSDYFASWHQPAWWALIRGQLGLFDHSDLFTFGKLFLQRRQGIHSTSELKTDLEEPGRYIYALFRTRSHTCFHAVQSFCQRWFSYPLKEVVVSTGSCFLAFSLPYCFSLFPFVGQWFLDSFYGVWLSKLFIDFHHWLVWVFFQIVNYAVIIDNELLKFE